jgi:hypothetical protein
MRGVLWHEIPIGELAGWWVPLVGTSWSTLRAISGPRSRLRRIPDRLLGGSARVHAAASDAGQGPRVVEVLYWRDAEAPSPPSAARVSAEPPEVAKIIDVRGLTPPEPMERTLAALEHLPDGQALVQINERIPACLIPVLEERGFAYTIADDPSGYRTTIWHRPA